MASPLQPPLTDRELLIARRVFDELVKHVEDIVFRELPRVAAAKLTDLAIQQRKDIGDELVRILLEKAFPGKT